MTLGFKTLSASSLLAISVLVHCGGDSPKAVVKGCSLPSDCNNPLICALGACHTACNESRDCPTGQRCLVTSAGSVCQLL